ncbi:ribonuclease P protein component [Pedobacter flavus]|uniref:Ribonuclease P protein component n=1 Tax=Pedobacter flavus TaxID=3113906 RepID=A0ABU7H2B7_9SPHI|nr:ribonuclease P protein component [Pedobacter sp. VNH31]MEE1885462.1 ribonuclease P protein component [Pedobacter sp. VNH31]
MKTFRKEERLCSKILLDKLFKNGSSFLLYPFRVTFLKVSESKTYPVQVVINVSKKRYKKAADRNTIKRRIRECYRLNKQSNLYDQLSADINILLSIQYVGKSIYPSSLLEEKLKKAMHKIVRNFVANEAS